MKGVFCFSRLPFDLSVVPSETNRVDVPPAGPMYCFFPGPNAVSNVAVV